MEGKFTPHVLCSKSKLSISILRRDALVQDLRTSLGQACARSLFTRWGEIREAVTMKRVNAAKVCQR